MRVRVQTCLGLVLAGLLLIVAGAGAQENSQTVPSIEFTGTVDPATEKWIAAALDEAADDDAPLAIIRLDTPGGLDSSMREIIKDVIDAPMPVVVYVSPDGARAASAGAFITEAADVAAMSPQTNIGSASAVDASGADIGGTLGEKIENDAAAFIRALAETHGRNGALAERMVTEAENVTAEEALDANAIDLVAADVDDLLAQLDGFRVEGPKAQVLATAGLEVDERDTPLQYEILQLIVNPTIAYLLILLGIVGIAIEVFSPGAIFPGAIGVISFLLGAYGTAQLPVTAAGIALLLAGIALVIVEAHAPTYGVLGVLGVVAIAISGLLLFDTGTDEVDVSTPAVIAIGVCAGGFLVFATQKALAARHNPVHTGWEELIGATGDVRQPLDPVGQVFVQGALWRARLPEGSTDSDAGRVRERGARVRVESVEGLTLIVRPDADETNEAEE
ncbi:MAG TPA: nodulation protein NfeD [Solirubrobacterales bacterium]|nr:nodulation protein NfeD [Solirubrobacterales bacterium]